MAAYRLVYDSHHLQADCQEPGSAPEPYCGDAFPIEGVLVATYLLSVEALPHCRCGVANKNRIV